MWIKTTAKGSGDAERLKESLEALDITISEDNDGRFTVCTTSEPLFCFVRDNLEGVDAVVKDALKSYIENFYNVRAVKITTKTVLVEDFPIKVERLTPISRVKPSLEYAVA